tara:strand:+ start:561 stop:749 length:189 start_codon:yes stop_codon:yes gene_type:complete
MFNNQTDLTNLFAELAEAEKEFEQCGIHLGLDPDNWEEQNKYEALEMHIECLKMDIESMQGI